MRRRIILLTALAAFVASCGDESAPTSIDRALLVGETLVKISGDDQLGIPGDMLPAVLRFAVRSGSATGPAVPDARGTIVVTSGGGTVSRATFRTNASGEATFRWTVGTSGVQSVTVTLNGGPSIVFTARLVPAGAQLKIIGGNNQTHTPGDSLPYDVRVKLVDAAGDPIPNAAGVPVRWSIVSGGGGLRFLFGKLNNAGGSTNRWQLGWGSTTQNIKAVVPGVDSVIFTATVNAAGYTLEIYNGNNQSAPASTLLSNPITIRVRNGIGTLIEGAKGTFAVTSGGGSLNRTTINTNSLGRESASWTLGASGAQQVTATIPVIGSVVFNASILAPPSLFDITIVYAVAPTAAQQAAVEAAVARWREIIIGDLPAINMTGAPAACGLDHTAGPIVDDILINVDFAYIDGPGNILGSAGPCYYRSVGLLPITGQLQLDAADLATMEANGTLADVILHEIGHVLGIGTMWQGIGLTSGIPGTDPAFTGPLAIAAFNANGGGGFVGTKVPIENCVGIAGCGAGTIYGHWRELVMGDELMTGYIDVGGPMPISIITVQMLDDMGYTVDTGAADAYTVSAALRDLYGDRQLIKLNEVPAAWKPMPFGN